MTATAEIPEAPAPAPAPAPVAAAPTVVIVDGKGVTVAQSSVGGNVSLDAIAYDDKGGIVLAGKGQPGNIVQVYVDNTLVAAVDIGPDGTWKAIPDIAPGVHSMRLDELDASGRVVSRFETPMQRETLEALAAAQAKAAPVPKTPTADAATTAPAVEATADAVTAEVAIQAAPATPAAAATDTPGVPTAAAAETAPAVDTTTPATAPAATASTETAATAPAAETKPASTTKAAAANVGTAASPDTTVSPPALVTVTVQPGFTLWGIARAQLGQGIEYLQIFDDNKSLIKDPDLIYPGQVFLIPKKN